MSLWTTGVLESQYIRAPISVPIPGSKACPSGLKPYYNVAVKEGCSLFAALT